MTTNRPRPRVVLRGDQTGEALSVTEMWLAPRADGPPLHHHDFDEAFCLLEGELTFSVAGEMSTVGPGEVAFAPRGVVHGLANRTDAPARYLLVCTPAGFERVLARRAATESGDEPGEWTLGPSPEVTVVGPPIGADG